MGRFDNLGLGHGTGGSPQGKLEQSTYEQTNNGLMNKLPTNDSQIKHMFRNAEGHLPNTPENHNLIETVANSPECYYGVDGRGLTWYSRIESDGSQIWVSIRNGVIQNAGKNLIPNSWDPETGFSRNVKRTSKKNKKGDKWRNPK